MDEKLAQVSGTRGEKKSYASFKKGRYLFENRVTSAIDNAKMLPVQQMAYDHW